MSQDKLKVLQEYLHKNLEKGFIQSSSSPAASPVLFIKKPEEGLHFCVDYWALNTMTIKNYYSLSLIQETLDCLTKAVIFIKLNIIAAFNKLQIAEGDE